MDNGKILSQEQVLDLVREYKKVIAPRFDGAMQVYLYGSYSKGYATPNSDIDVAVIVPSFGDKWFVWSKGLWHDVDKVSFLIEPMLLAEDQWSPLYDDVMLTGIAV